MSDEYIGNCWHCGQGLGKHEYGRETNCLQCGKATRCCSNCRWYDPGRANDCQEPVAEKVMDKEQPNFCDFFEPGRPQTKASDGDDALRQAAEELFKL